MWRVDFCKHIKENICQDIWYENCSTAAFKPLVLQIFENNWILHNF